MVGRDVMTSISWNSNEELNRTVKVPRVLL